MRITTIQARTQGTFEVELFSDRGFGGHVQDTIWSRAKAWWEGAGGKAPEANRFIDFIHLQSSFF